MSSISLFLSLGSNEGARANYLQNATTRIAHIPQSTLAGASEIYETSAWGNETLAPFLNQILHVKSNLSAQDFFLHTLQIERDLGRVRKQAGERWQARTIDIDLLFYGDKILTTDTLTLPHPRIAERRFILQILCDMGFGSWQHPLVRVSVQTLLARCTDPLSVQKYTLSTGL